MNYDYQIRGKNRWNLTKNIQKHLDLQDSLFVEKYGIIHLCCIYLYLSKLFRKTKVIAICTKPLKIQDAKARSKFWNTHGLNTLYFAHIRFLYFMEKVYVSFLLDNINACTYIPSLYRHITCNSIKKSTAQHI